jgi:hypothetical protein
MLIEILIVIALIAVLAMIMVKSLEVLWKMEDKGNEGFFNSISSDAVAFYQTSAALHPADSIYSTKLALDSQFTLLIDVGLTSSDKDLWGHVYHVEKYTIGTRSDTIKVGSALGKAMDNTTTKASG